MAKANDLFNAGDSEGALALYDDVLSRNQDSFEVYCNRGAALDNLNRYTFTFLLHPQAVCPLTLLLLVLPFPSEQDRGSIRIL